MKRRSLLGRGTINTFLGQEIPGDTDPKIECAVLSVREFVATAL
jgi:hypothetical protein